MNCLSLSIFDFFYHYYMILTHYILKQIHCDKYLSQLSP